MSETLSLVEQVKAAMKAAMKAREKQTLSTIRLIQADFKRIEVDERIEIDDARAIAIMDKMVKQRRDSTTQFQDAGRDELAAIEIAEIARNKKLPKLKIIPLDAIPKFKLTLPKESGVIGVLSDFVKSKDAYSALKTFLFGNIVLVETRESAYNLSQLGYKSVTLSGEYFEAKNGTVVIDINSKISKLTKLISMSSDIDGLIQSISLIKKYMLKKKHSLKKLDDSIQSYSDRLSLSENALTSVSENYSNIQSRISSAKQTKEKLTQRISDLTSRNNIISSEVSTNESHHESLLDRISIVEQNYASGEQTRIASELSKINIKKSDVEKRYTTIMNEYRDKSSQLTTMQTQDNREKSQTSRLNDEETSLHSEFEQIEIKIQDLENIFVLHESAENRLSQIEINQEADVILIVGPEGGLSESEVNTFVAAGAKIVRLGESVLRAANAGAAATSVVMSRTGKW